MGTKGQNQLLRAAQQRRRQQQEEQRLRTEQQSQHEESEEIVEAGEVIEQPQPKEHPVFTTEHEQSAEVAGPMSKPVPQNFHRYSTPTGPTPEEKPRLSETDKPKKKKAAPKINWMNTNIADDLKEFFNKVQVGERTVVVSNAIEKVQHLSTEDTIEVIKGVLRMSNLDGEVRRGSRAGRYRIVNSADA